MATALDVAVVRMTQYHNIEHAVFLDVVTGPVELRLLAAMFAELPVHVLWRLSKTEAPDAAAIAALNLGNNTKVSAPLEPLALEVGALQCLSMQQDGVHDLLQVHPDAMRAVHHGTNEIPIKQVCNVTMDLWMAHGWDDS